MKIFLVQSQWQKFMEQFHIRRISRELVYSARHSDKLEINDFFSADA